MDQQELMKAIMAIQRDTSLTDGEKARRRQELLSGKFQEDHQVKPEEESGSEDAKKAPVRYAQAEEEEEDEEVGLGGGGARQRRSR